MEHQAKLDTLKQLLGLEESTGLLEFALNDAEETICNYCNLDEVPEGLSNTCIRMAADIYRSENYGDGITTGQVSAITEGDVSTSFSSLDDTYRNSVLKCYEKTLMKYRKVVF